MLGLTPAATALMGSKSIKGIPQRLLHPPSCLGARIKRHSGDLGRRFQAGPYRLLGGVDRLVSGRSTLGRGHTSNLLSREARRGPDQFIEG